MIDLCYSFQKKQKCFVILKYVEIFINSLSQNSDIPEKKKRTTKKGIITTILIVAGIVAASFLVYLIP
jgi:hypothetical protein